MFSIKILVSGGSSSDGQGVDLERNTETQAWPLHDSFVIAERILQQCIFTFQDKHCKDSSTPVAPHVCSVWYIFGWLLGGRACSGSFGDNCRKLQSATSDVDTAGRRNCQNLHPPDLSSCTQLFSRITRDLSRPEVSLLALLTRAVDVLGRHILPTSTSTYVSGHQFLVAALSPRYRVNVNGLNSSVMSVSNQTCH